jgi:hypothetical protein
MKETAASVAQRSLHGANSHVIYIYIYMYILHHVDPLLGNDREVSKYTRAVAE